MRGWGGDEFAIILTDAGNPDHIMPVAAQIIRALSDPFLAGEACSHIGASIGITLYPADGTNSEELLKKADTAMYRAKEEGRTRTQPDRHANVRECHHDTGRRDLPLRGERCAAVLETGCGRGGYR